MSQNPGTHNGTLKIDGEWMFTPQNIVIHM